MAKKSAPKRKPKKTKKQIRQQQLNKEYSRQRDRIVKRVKALREHDWAIDPAEAIPPTIAQLGHNVTKSDIKRLSKITPETLRKNSLGFVNLNTGEIEPPEVGLQREKLEKQINAQVNLIPSQLKTAKKTQHGLNYGKVMEDRFKGEQLLSMYKRFSDPEERNVFLQWLTPEELNLLNRAIGSETEANNFRLAAQNARKEKEKQKEARRERARQNRESKSRKNILTDEGDEPEQIPIQGEPEAVQPEIQSAGSGNASESAENYEDSDEDQEYEEDNSGRTREQIEQDIEKQYEVAEKAWKWRDDYERQKRVKDWKKREFAKDSETIIASIDERINQFEQYMQSSQFDSRYWYNGEKVSILKRALKGAIQKDGLTEVLKRLDGKANEIDEYLTNILNQYRNTDIIDNGVNAMVEIFWGRALTLSESTEISDSYGESSLNDEEDIPLYIVDYDE